MSDLERQEAHRLLDEGFSPIPLARFEKMPPKGFLFSKPEFSVDTHEKVDRVFWGEGDTKVRVTWAGVGVNLKGSPYFVVDIDGPVGVENLRELIDQHGELPSTRTVRSGRENGGYHLYFASDEKIRSTQIADKIDIKGNATNSICVVPPSLHKSGNRYSYIHSKIATMLGRNKTVACPEWLLDIVRTQTPTEPARVFEQSSGGIAGDYGLPSCMVIAPPIDARQDGDAYQGEHPYHGPTSGKDHKCNNFRIDSRKDVWHCFAHNTGGGPLKLYAVMKGIIECKNVTPGSDWLREYGREVIKALEEDGYESKRKAEDAEITAPLMAKIYGVK